MSDKPAGIGAAYLRVSTDEQNVTHQKREITAWLAERGLTIPDNLWLIDEGWSRGQDEIRPEFQRLLRLIEGNKINWVVCFNHDRFAASTPLRFMSYMSLLEGKGIHLYSTSEVEYGNLASSDILPLLMNAIHSSRTSSEIITKADRAIQGIVTHAGNAMGATAPYGYDKVCYSPEGREKWRLVLERHEGHKHGAKPVKTRIWADGRTETYEGAGNNPKPDDQDVMRVAPSVHTDRHTAIQLIFDLWTNQNLGASQIANILAATPGIKPPPNPNSKWSDQYIRQIVVNPLYAYGVQVRFKNSHAQYFERRDGKSQLISKLPGQILKRGRKRARTDWVIPAVKGEGLVSEALWEAAYKKFTEGGKQKAPRNPDRWLSGIIFCECGLPMRALTQRSRVRNKKQKQGYACRSYYNKQRQSGPACRRNFVREEILETAIVKYLSETGEKLATLTQTPAARLVEMAERIVNENEGLTISSVLPPGDLYRESALSLDDGINRYCKLITKAWRELKEKGVPMTGKALSTQWEAANRGKTEQAKETLLEAEDKLDQMLDSWASLRPGPAKDRLKLKIEQQEDAVAALRQASVPLSEKLEEARAMVNRCKVAWSSPRKADTRLRVIWSVPLRS